jgi:cytoskeletal protein CcmA (bactofilin family)
MANFSNIGRGTTIRGSIRGEGDLEIQGRVEGSVVVTGELVIGEGALIKSDVSGRRVVVRGAISGNVTANESVVLEAGARVVGDLGAPQIGIRPGALVRGNVSTGGGAPTASRARATSRATPAARASAHATAAVASSASKSDRSVGDGRRSGRAAGGPPPPIVPSLKKGAKASFVKRKAAR